MGSVQSSPYFGSNTSDDIKRGFSAIAGMFAPPSGQELAGYASAKDSNAAAALKKQKLDQIAQFYEMAQNPNADHTVFDQTNAVVNGSPLSTGYYGVDQNNATELAKNKQDNLTKFLVTRFGSVNQDAMLPAVPAADNPLGTGAMPQVNGLRTPLSETQVKGSILQGLDLTPEQRLALGMADAKTENIVGPDGKSEIVYSPQAVGREPAYAPNREVVVNDGFGQPPTDTAWVRNPDGSVKLDARGVPMAAAVQGSKTYAAQQDAERQANDKAAKTQTSGNIVLQDIGRALSAIAANPGLTTGMGAKLTSWWDGGPAANVHALTDSIRVNVGLDQLQAMRNSNPTGAGLGNVTERENAMLQAALGSLEQSQDDKQLTDNLARVANIYADIVYGVGNGPPRERLSFPSQWDAYAAPSAGPSVEVQRGGALPPGVTEDDVQFTAKKYGLTRQQVLQRLGAH